MKNCPKCGKEVDDKAILCVGCGTPLKVKKPIFKKWWFWVIIVVVVVAIMGAAGESDTGNTSGGDTSNAQSQTSVVSKEEISYEVVDLRTMLDELDENALKAEREYQDKYIEVTGRIDNFDSDGDYISIEPTNADAWNFNNVMCYIEDDAQLEFLLEKSVGDTVTIRGQVTSIGEVLGYSIEIAEVY